MTVRVGPHLPTLPVNTCVHLCVHNNHSLASSDSVHIILTKLGKTCLTNKFYPLPGKILGVQKMPL